MNIKVYVSLDYVEKTVTQENQFYKSSTKVHQKVQQFLFNSLISSLLTNSNYYEKFKIQLLFTQQTQYPKPVTHSSYYHNETR